MAVFPVFPPRPALLVCACMLLAPVARAEAPAPGARPAPTAEAAPANKAEAPAARAAPAQVAAPAPASTPQPTLDEHPSLPPGMEEEPESVTWLLTRTLLMLGAVVGLIYLTLNVGLRKLMGLQGVSMGRSSVVSVVERVALDQRRTLFVLKAADEYLLVGGGEAGLQLLSKLDTEAVERIRAARPASNVVSISPFLQKLLARRDATQQGATRPSGTQPPGA
ncbi:MAG: flagellar biosynthetic protein FliO [Archangium sp.]